MEKWKGKVAIVTGVTSGIGAAVAKKLVEAGLKVVGLGRRKERGDTLSKALNNGQGQFYFFPVDITEETEVLRIFKWIKNCLGPVHILINNAGVKRLTTLLAGDSKMWKETFDINVLALCVMTREAVKNMRENNVQGHIIHVNSIAGHKVVYAKDANVYFASKHAVTALTETLRLELNAARSKIKITSISPDVVNTEMLDPKYTELSERLKNRPLMEPEDVADSILYVLSTPSHVQVHEVMLRSLSKHGGAA